MRWRHALLSLCLFTVGCGFHLRGINDVPQYLSPLAIVNQGVRPDMIRMVKGLLSAYKINELSNPSLSHYQLIFTHDRLDKEITGIAASTAPRQYQLYYKVSYILKAPGGRAYPEKSVYVSRQVTINNDRILGSDMEEATIIKEMQRDASVQLFSALAELHSTREPSAPK